MTQTKSYVYARRFAFVTFALGALVLVFVALLPSKAPNVARPSAAASAPEPIVLPPSKPRPNYVVVDGGRYGYETALSSSDRADGVLAAPVVMLAYNGLVDGAHQLMPMTDADVRSGAPGFLITFDWTPGDRFIKRSTFVGGKFREKEFLRAVPDAVVMGAMRDAELGLLSRYVHSPQKSERRVFVYCTEAKGCASEQAPS